MDFFRDPLSVYQQTVDAAYREERTQSHHIVSNHGTRAIRVEFAMVRCSIHCFDLYKQGERCLWTIRSYLTWRHLVTESMLPCVH